MAAFPSNLNPTPPPTSGTFGAFKPPEVKRRQARLYILLGVLLVLAVAVGLYLSVNFGLVTLQTPPPIPPAQELNITEIRVSRLSGFNFDVINLDIYKALKLHGAIPIKVEALGRANPFAPF